MTAPQTILANAHLVLPTEVVRGALVIEGDRIAQIDTGTTVPPGALDCDGDLLAPGLIELHTDNLERHMSPRPGVTWPPAQAIAAHDAELASVGITTVFDAMRIGSILTGQKTKYIRYARPMAELFLALRARRALRISHFLHLRAEICSETLVDEFEEFAPEDRVGIVSLMDHTPGQRQFRDISKFRQYLMGKRGLTEDEFQAHVEHLYSIQAQFGAEHEAQAVAHGKRLGAVLASHDDTTAQQVAHSTGHGVSLAEFPTTHEAAQACRDAGLAVMMGAPNLLRGGSHSGNVAASDLAASGLLDILSSDYAPSSLLCAAIKLGQEAGDLALGLKTVTAAPALAARLTDRGALSLGLRADLVRIHLDRDVPVVRGLWVQGDRRG
ncbi:MAG: alpha-D-ribose 1-methylphosphonate 5-triphosphate diphosphatase [Pseudomonadota bacterium]